MIELFKKKKKSAPLPPAQELAQKRQFLFAHFVENENHYWIKNNRMLVKGMALLVEQMNLRQIQFFLNNKTFIIPCQAHLSCAIGKTKNDHLILVFPELLVLLKSASFLHGIAILAHELGHIYYQHTENKIETLKAQIEADDFAFELGFGEELQEILLEHAHINTDCRVRIDHLTKKLILK